MEEYVREWYGHRTKVFKMEEYVREWHGHLTRVFCNSHDMSVSKVFRKVLSKCLICALVGVVYRH